MEKGLKVIEKRIRRLRLEAAKERLSPSGGKPSKKNPDTRFQGRKPETSKEAMTKILPPRKEEESYRGNTNPVKEIPSGN